MKNYIIRKLVKLAQKSVPSLEVCTGCGHIKVKNVPLKYYLKPHEFSCCPDSNYIDLQEYCGNSLTFQQIYNINN